MKGTKKWVEMKLIHRRFLRTLFPFNLFIPISTESISTMSKSYDQIFLSYLCQLRTEERYPTFSDELLRREEKLNCIMLVFHSNSKTLASSIYIMHFCKTLVKNELYPFYVYVCCSTVFIVVFPPGNYMFKVNNKDTRTTPLASFWSLYC